MKSTTTLLTFIFALSLMITGITLAEDQDDESQARGHAASMREDRIEMMIDNISESDPEKAKQLQKLRDEDPEAFKIQMREIVRESMGGRFAKKGDFEERGMRRPRRGEPGEDGQMCTPKDPRQNRRRQAIRGKLQAKEQELVNWLNENDPNTAKELATLKENNQSQYIRRLSIELKKHREIIDAESKNPALAAILKDDLKLKDQRNDLLKQISETQDENEKGELIEELENVISKRFDVLLKKKQVHYEELKKRLEDLKTQVEKNEKELGDFKDNKSVFIDDRVEALTSGGRNFKWN